MFSREFSVFRATECVFTCRAGFDFDATRNDCFAPVLRASTRNAFTHSLNVINWGRTAAGFLFTVTHSNHSRFVVAVGRAAPTSCAAIVKLRRFRETKGATGGPAPRNRRAHEDGRRSHNDNRSESRYGRVEPALQRTMRNSLLAMAQGRHTR